MLEAVSDYRPREIHIEIQNPAYYLGKILHSWRIFLKNDWQRYFVFAIYGFFLQSPHNPLFFPMKYLTIAIIAHVDHGKTTLVDALLKQGGAFRDNQAVDTCVMDSNDQEKERGITIYAKNTAIQIGDTKVNIVDTPGHADFGSEVERVLRMADSVLLLVDAYEGPMPQTRFVLRKSLELGIKPIVVINKIDKPTARPAYVLDAVFDLFVQLGATDEQCDFAHIYTIARDGVAKRELADQSTNLQPLFDLILEKVQPRENDVTKPFRMQIANLAYDSFTGRQGIGRIADGTIKTGANVFVIGNDGVKRKAKISKVTTSLGLQKAEIKEAEAGDIVSIAGIPDIFVGETVTVENTTEALPPITIDPPTLKMQFFVNDSPFAGKRRGFCNKSSYPWSSRKRTRDERRSQSRFQRWWFICCGWSWWASPCRPHRNYAPWRIWNPSWCSRSYLPWRKWCQNGTIWKMCHQCPWWICRFCYRKNG
jgi:GTP-binding protein TypA/BipA